MPAEGEQPQEPSEANPLEQRVADLESHIKFLYALLDQLAAKLDRSLGIGERVTRELGRLDRDKAEKSRRIGN